MNSANSNLTGATATSRSLRILLVEDHHDIAANVCDSFEKAGHTVDYAENAEQALGLISSARFDLLIIDIMLPDRDGIGLCSELRKKQLSDAPILMLTARDDLNDKLAAFDAGADDYLTKPFAIQELLARVVVLSRRGIFRDGSRLKVGDLEVDPTTHKVFRGDTEITLTRIGFSIVLTLARASPTVVLRDDLEHAVWGDDRPETDALRTHISYVRAAVDRPFPTAMIQTVHGAGWCIVET